MSCAEQGNEEKKVMILGVTPEQIVELKGEELPIQELIPTSICRLDSFLVILNMEEEKIVRVYQADTYRFLGAFLEKGRGDDEVISCQEIWAAPWKGKMRLWLKAPQNFIGVVDWESSLTAGKPCWEKQYKFMDRGMADFLYRPVFALNDSVFWISRAERPYDIIPNQNIRKNADGSIRILSMQETTHVGGKNLYWLSYNYASATVLDSVWYTDYDDIRDFDQLFLGDEAMSPDRRRIAVAFHNMNQIILYDSKMQNFRWLTTDNELPLLNSSESFGKIILESIVPIKRFCHELFPRIRGVRSNLAFRWRYSIGKGLLNFNSNFPIPLNILFWMQRKVFYTLRMKKTASGSMMSGIFYSGRCPVIFAGRIRASCRRIVGLLYF
ncbi:MAG: hypothetical protein ACLU30_11635 [Odoribacter splanchnicus]